MEALIGSDILPVLTGLGGVFIGFLLNFLEDIRRRSNEDKNTINAIYTEINELLEPVVIVLNIIELYRKNNYLSDMKVFNGSDLSEDFFRRIDFSIKEIENNYNNIKKFRNELNSSKKFESFNIKIQAISHAQRQLINNKMQLNDYKNFDVFVAMVNGIQINLERMVKELKNKEYTEFIKEEPNYLNDK